MATPSTDALFKMRDPAALLATGARLYAETWHDELLEEIRAALEHGLPWVALNSLLTIPDMCAALGDPDGKTSGPKYKAWVTDYLPRWANTQPDATWSPTMLWKLRCSMLHQGSPHGQSPLASRPLFIPPDLDAYADGAGRVVADGQVATFIDLNSLLADMRAGVESWLQAVSETDRYAKNVGRLLTYHRDGLWPFTDGIPTIG